MRGRQKAEGSSSGPGTAEGGKNDIASRAQRRKNLPGGISPYLEGYCLLHARRARARAHLRVSRSGTPYRALHPHGEASRRRHASRQRRRDAPPHPHDFSPTNKRE
jgi:hypothetical protein